MLVGAKSRVCSSQLPPRFRTPQNDKPDWEKLPIRSHLTEESSDRRRAWLRFGAFRSASRLHTSWGCIHALDVTRPLAEGSARYFADDNFSSLDEGLNLSRWAGIGALHAGLNGTPTPAQLEALLGGRMPDGSVIRPGGNAAHSLGSDFVFSVPRSVSLLAYLGGDERLLDANRVAVADTMSWAEGSLAVMRKRSGTVLSTVPTGNLLMALFEHDTSRELDPHAHIHVIIVNATRAPSGDWRALHNRPLWRANAALGEMHATCLRDGVEAIGYRTLGTGKHGMFEIEAVPPGAIKAFSNRRRQLLARAGRLSHATPKALDAAQRSSRRNKLKVVDRRELLTFWQRRAFSEGLDLRSLVEAVTGRVGCRNSP